MKEIARRRPIDRAAARVTSAGPKGYESDKQIAQVYSATPLPLRPIPAHPSLPDLTGTTRGLLTVVGLWAERHGEKALWVCRCVCGYYVTRRTKALTNTRNASDRCDRCRQVAWLRRTSVYQQLGYNPDETE